MTTTLLRTPLYDSHVQAGARLVPFAGYELPVQYEGVIAESRAVRTAAGMFDVSHMARLRFHGENCLAFLESITSNDVSKLADGQGQYSLLTNKTGGVVDDIIVYRVSVNEFRMVVNAANHQKDWEWINSENSFGIQIEDHTNGSAMIAVQGPAAVEILASIAEFPEEIRSAPLFGVVHGHIAGVPCFAARSGYTGEDGYELICTADHAAELWGALVGKGVVPCGLGSRDVLRVEAGLPLYGHELSDNLSPIAAGLGWVIGKEKSFNGSEAIRAAQANPPAQKLVGIRLESKRVPIIGSSVNITDVGVGEICSGVFSPTLGCGIGFAFVERSVALETPCEVDFRGKAEAATVVGKRFLKKPKS